MGWGRLAREQNVLNTFWLTGVLVLLNPSSKQCYPHFIDDKSEAQRSCYSGISINLYIYTYIYEVGKAGLDLIKICLASGLPNGNR